MKSATLSDISDTFSLSESGQMSARVVSPDDSVIEELADVFPRSDEAILLVERAGFPRSRIPVFESPMLFWARVAREARSGAVYGGLQSILEVAVEMYPANQVLADGLSDSLHPMGGSGASGHRMVVRSARSTSNRWLLRLGVLTALLVAFIIYRPYSQATSIIACTIRIQDEGKIGTGWVMHLDSGAIYSVDVNGAAVSFRCPPEGCNVAFVVDLENGEIRHWSNISVSSDAVPLVSLKDSERGAPDEFIERGIEQGVLDSGRLSAHGADFHGASDGEQPGLGEGVRAKSAHDGRRSRKGQKKSARRSAGKIRIQTELARCQVSIGPRVISCRQHDERVVTIKSGKYAVKWRKTKGAKWMNAGAVDVSSGTSINLDLMKSGLFITTRQEYREI